MPLTEEGKIERKNFNVLLEEVKLKIDLPEKDLIYLAGIIDGEGCIGVFTREHNAKWIRPHLQITNTSPELYDWLKARIPFGQFYWNKEKRLNRKPSWIFRVACENAIKIIRAVNPYLVIKSKQAEILLALDLFERSFVRTPFGKLHQEISELRIQCFESIRSLNWRARYAVN